MKITQLFPIEIIQHTVSEQTRDITKQKVENYINEHLDFLNIPPTEIVKTTFNHDKQFIKTANLTELQNEIENSLFYFLNHLKCGLKTDFSITSWLNVFDNGIMEQEHSHAGSIISGTYYVSSDNTENSGCFYIPDHISERPITRKLFSLNYDIENCIIPEEGNIILFESWMRHGINPNKTNKPRISIAFNIGQIEDLK